MEDMVRAIRQERDTRKRLDLAEELISQFTNEDWNYQDLSDYAGLFAGLASWIRAASIQVSVTAMRVLGVIVGVMKTDFQPHLSTIYDPLMERLGDQKEPAREGAQTLLQLIMREGASNPQTLLDRLMEVCLVHKNWRVKEQGLTCLTKTLSYFGAGELVVSRHVEAICVLLGDANSNVRAAAMETLVDIYSHVGHKLRADLARRDISTAKMKVLLERFNEIDITTHTHNHSSDLEVCHREDGVLDVSNGVRGVAIPNDPIKRPTKSAHSSTSNEPSFPRQPYQPRPPSAASSRTTASMSSSSVSSTGSSGAVDRDNFHRAFSETPDSNFHSRRELEKKLHDIADILKHSEKAWDMRVAALKEFRGLVRLNQSVVSKEAYTPMLKDMQECMVVSLKDLRSQIIKEACVTVSHICTVLRHGAAGFGAEMIPPLILLLPNSAKVMASSAEVCMHFIIKHSPSSTLLHHLSKGFSSKSSHIRRCCSEFLCLCLEHYDGGQLTKLVSVVENLLTQAIRDADATARKFGRRAFWKYHAHFPSNASHFLETFNRQEQKYISDERPSISDSEVTGMTASLKAATITDCQSPPSASSHPSVRVTRPTVRKAQSSKTLRPASSMENLNNMETSGRVSPNQSPRSKVSSRAPGNRPSSRSAMQRPSSRSAVRRPDSRTSSRADKLPGKGLSVKTMPRMSRSAQPSPSHSRESSPSGLGYHGHQGPGGRRKMAPLTADSLLKIYGSGPEKRREEEDDDAVSVSSDRSVLSFSSEISYNPCKFTQPVEDLNELIAMCSTSQWAERRDGIVQLHMLLESSRTFSQSDMDKIKAVFKRMFQEPHAKVYSMFLDTLSKFISDYREYLEDWLFLLLLRLLQRSGTDMLSSVLFKLQMVLENVRSSFDPDAQLSALFRIANDPTQTLNTKVKLAYLEYLLELVPMLDSADFKETQESRGAICKVVKFTTEPKSAEIRRLSQKTIIALFDLNPATFSLLQRSLSKSDQDNANKILKTYMSELPNSGDESDKEATPTHKERKLSSKASHPTPKSPRAMSKQNTTPTLPPSGLRGLKGARTISSSSPNMYGTNVTMSLPSSSRQPRLVNPNSSGRTTPSMIPTPRKYGIRRPMSTTPGSSPSTPRTSREKTTPTRSASVGPEKLASQLAASRKSVPSNGGTGTPSSYGHKEPLGRKIARPNSARSDYSVLRYQNGDDGDEPEDFRSCPTSDFSLSDLPSLDFDSPEEDEGGTEHKAGYIRVVEKKLLGEEKHEGLQLLYSVLHDFPGQRNWRDHFKPIFLRLMVILDDPDSAHKLLVLRILREILKVDGLLVKDYAEMTTMKVLKCYAHQDTLISQGSEDIFPLLAPVIPVDCAIPLLTPLLLKESHPMLLGVMKFLQKVLGETIDEEYMRSKLSEIVPAITRGYCHSESSVRKASVFCLVAVYRIVGEDMKEHLHKLSSSQKKLLDMYIKRGDGSSRPGGVGVKTSSSLPTSSNK